jgi:hypothetical protein
MPWWAITCAAFFGVITGAAGLLVVVLTIRLLSHFGGLFRRLEPTLLAVEMESQMLELRSEELAASQERLAASRARLDASLARLKVLDWALGDVRRILGIARLIRPAK